MMTNTTPIEPSTTELTELTYTECLDRLRSKRVGRLSVVVDHYPQVFPMNYCLDQHIVVLRTHHGIKLTAANHANVGFQVDDIDPRTHTGWSVLIQGMAEDVSDRSGHDPTTERSQALAAQPWAPGEHPRVVRIIPSKVTGRQLSPGDLGSSPDEPVGTDRSVSVSGTATGDPVSGCAGTSGQPSSVSRRRSAPERGSLLMDPGAVRGRSRQDR
jgi:uncharacterized protein